MSEANRLFMELLKRKSKKQIIEDTSKLIDGLFERKIHDMELYARIFYASILSNYIRARSLGSNVGIILPELEAITKALYAMSRVRSAKQGSFEPAKAFEIANSLSISYKVPIAVQSNTLSYKVTFTIDHPALIALEKGEVSWQDMEKSKIIRILEAALGNLPTAKNRKFRRSEAFSSVATEIKKAIRQLNSGNFQIKNNKRKYMEIAVKNLVKEKDFINILIK